MNMIRHDNKHVQLDIWVLTRQVFPHRFDHPTIVVQAHLVFFDSPEEAFTFASTGSHKVGAGLRVIIFLQANSPAMVHLIVESWHGWLRLLRWATMRGRLYYRHYTQQNPNISRGISEFFWGPRPTQGIVECRKEGTTWGALWTRRSSPAAGGRVPPDCIAAE